MSRAYYGIFNDTIYEIDGTNMNPNLVVRSSSSMLRTSIWNNSEVHVDVQLNNLEPEADSNKEAVEAVVQKIQSEGTTSIEKLSSNYRAYVNFSIYDEVNKAYVDEECLVKDVNLLPAYFPLGLTEDDEYLVRMAMVLSTEFSRVYRSTVPMGISKPKGKHYTLYIDKIVITQILYTPFEEVVYKRDHTGSKYNIEVGGPAGHHGIPGRPFDHPSMRVHSLNDMRHAKSVEIYNSESNGDVFEPIAIDNDLQKVVIRLDISLGDYIVLASESNPITEAIQVNVDALDESGEDTENPDIDGDGDNIEDPDDGSEEGEDGEDENGGDNSEKGTTEESGSPEVSESTDSEPNTDSESKTEEDQ
jgi:hypothetical protein